MWHSVEKNPEAVSDSRLPTTVTDGMLVSLDHICLHNREILSMNMSGYIILKWLVAPGVARTGTL